jgi:predicted transcriptional regulator of viral defense system
MGYFIVMQTITEKTIQHGLVDRFIRVEQLSRLVGGSAGRRYGLVNRAIKSGELLRLQRGLYILADRYRTHHAHPFALAQALAPGSYISFETALSYHGWIPEKVFITASVVPGRKSRRYENEITGTYSFYSLATEPGRFLELVNRHHIDGQTMLVAKPCRALMDLVCLRKIAWEGPGWLSEGLRIDPDLLRGITRQDVNTLKQVYKHKRLKSFLSSLCRELRID